MRTGDDYLAALDDGREVWYDGERVKNVTTHAAFRNTARSFARLYDLTNDATTRDVLSGVSLETGTRSLRAYQIPRSRADLIARRNAFKVWAEASFGYLGRSPDYIGSAIAGFAAAPQVFTGKTFDGAANLLGYYRKVLEGGLYLAHTLVDPQSGRTDGPHAHPDSDLRVRVVSERDDGIVVCGAKMIGTAAAFADEILVGGTAPLAPADADHALLFAVPMSAAGVKVVSRVSYESDAFGLFDNPLSSRFDENDALLVYENVFVPWDRVFVYRDVDIAASQWWRTSAFVNFMHHGATRLWTKLEFLTGLGLLIAKTNGTYDLPPVKAQLGRLLSWMNTAKSLVLAMETDCQAVDSLVGAIETGRELSVSTLATGPDLYVKSVTELKLLCGGAAIMTPASVRDLQSPDLAPVIRKYLGWKGDDAEGRIKLLKLAWDALGSAFGGRHEQYERFYHGAPHNYLQTIVRQSDAESCQRLVEKCLAGYAVE